MRIIQTPKKFKKPRFPILRFCTEAHLMPKWKELKDVWGDTARACVEEGGDWRTGYKCRSGIYTVEFPDVAMRDGLNAAFRLSGKHSAVFAMLEVLNQSPKNEEFYASLTTKALLREGATDPAQHYFNLFMGKRA